MKFLLQSSFLLCMLLALGVAADRPYNSYYSSGQICTTHSDCSGGQFCGINGYCYCLPNLVYRAASRNCSQLACDTNYKSCPETYNCVHNVCTKYCDMESNNCKTETVYKYYHNEAYRIAFIVVSSVGSFILLMAAKICCAFVRKNRITNRDRTEETDDPLIGQEKPAENTSKVYSFFLCFTSRTPMN